MLCHPTQLRPLSVAEYTRLQQFPDGWKFAGGIPQQYIQAGNAVPVGLGKAIGEAIRKAMRRRKDEMLLGKIVCENTGLIERMSNRPRTVLNPGRMRLDASIEAAREWLAAEDKYRHSLLDFIDRDDDEQEAPAEEGAQPLNGRRRKR
jgi:DNA (cytosine-5)-methyltransferase 1